MGYYSYTNQHSKFEMFQRRLKILLQNKTVSNELENSSLVYSKIKSSKIEMQSKNLDQKEQMWEVVKASQAKQDISERIIDRELKYQENNIALRFSNQTQGKKA